MEKDDIHLIKKGDKIRVSESTKENAYLKSNIVTVTSINLETKVVHWAAESIFKMICRSGSKAEDIVEIVNQNSPDNDSR